MSKPLLTDREMEILVAALQCLKDDKPLAIDTTKLAEKTGFKTAASANASWCIIKKKLFTAGETPTKDASTADPSKLASPGTPSKPATSRKAKTPKSPKNLATATETDAPEVKQEVKQEATALVADTPASPQVDASTFVVSPSAASTTDAPETPNKATPKKRVRKTKAEKEAEGNSAAATSTDAAAPGADTQATAGGPEETGDAPPAKKRKTPVKKVNKEKANDRTTEGGEAAVIKSAVEQATVKKPAKTPVKRTPKKKATTPADVAVSSNGEATTATEAVDSGDQNGNGHDDVKVVVSIEADDRELETEAGSALETLEAAAAMANVGNDPDTIVVARAD